MQKAFELSVVVVNYNTFHLLKCCLINLQEICIPAKEILVVDNASTDGSREWLQTLRDERIRCILSSKNLGFARGCNLGIRQATGEFILLLNTDAFPRPGAIETLVAYLEQHSDVGIVGPQLLYPNGRWQRSSGRIPSPCSAFLDALGVTSLEHIIAAALWPLTGRWWRPYEVEYVDGACMLIRRIVIEQIGGLDERFFLFVEDAEYCARARAHGWKVVYLPQSHVVHLRGGSSAQKNYEHAIRMRVYSEKRFVVETQGENAWRCMARWRQLGFAWRMWLARFTRQKVRYEHYRAAYHAYREATL